MPLVMRAHVFGSISGGCSTVLRRFLRRAFVDPGNFGESGILVPRPDGNVAQIKIKMKTMLTDGEGHQKTLEWNGPASLRPTFYFANVWKLDSGMEGGGDVEIDCSDRSLMRKWDRDRWYSNIDAVLDARRRHGNGEMTQAELNKRITAARYCPTPNGLLADRELRAVIDCYTACKYDFMHVAFQDGFASHAMWLVVQVGLDELHRVTRLLSSSSRSSSRSAAVATATLCQMCFAQR